MVAQSELAHGKGAMIDNKSMADYKNQFENQRLQNRNASVAEICFRVKEYIKRRIDGIVDVECRKRIMDITTVALSCLSSMVIPFSGVAVVVAATVIQCLNFAITLGLIPLLNVRSFNDLVAMSKQIGSTIKRAGKSSLMAGVETAVLEILKNLGLGDWLWTEILRDILYEMIGDCAMDAAWIMTPLLAAPKYMMHRHLIKKMYRKLGDKAEVVHKTWMEQTCVQGAQNSAIGVQTTVISQVAGGVQVDACGNVQGAYIQAQEVCATQVQNGGTQVSQTNAYFQQQAPQQWPACPPSSQAPYNPNPVPGMVPGMVPGYPQVPQQQDSNSYSSFFQPQPAAQPQGQMPPANSFFQPQPAAKPSATVIMGYTPPANSSFFQPQPAAKHTGTLIMGHTPPANSSFFQPQAGGQFQGPPAPQTYNASQPQAGGYFQCAAAAAQTYTPQPNPTYYQQPAPYGTQQTQQVYPPQAPPQGPPQGNPYVQMGDYNKPQVAPASSPYGNLQPQASPYVQMGEYNKPQAQVAYPQAGTQQAYPPQAGYQAPAPQPDLWYKAQV